MRAYDLAILARPADRGAPDCHGWCYGLPPGLAPEQWPLDPANGYPLQHGFTLLLPEEYRCHGPDIVAVAFFASPIDLHDGGPIVMAPGIRAAMTAPDQPADPELAPFWRAERAAHPRLHRFKDLIGVAYAVILLTQAEYEGPLCSPPKLESNQHRDALDPPGWLTRGSAAAYRTSYASVMRPVQVMFADDPPAALATSRALAWTPRAHDPNAGKVPRDLFWRGPSDYVQPLFATIGEDGEETFEEHAWAEAHASNHIGGTMRPTQGVPACSPYYVEFDEWMGGYNFGGGNAQLDLRELKFDWACG